MLRQIAISTLMTTFIVYSNAQTQSPYFLCTVGGVKDDRGTNVANDYLGNTFFIGTFRDTVVLDENSDTITLLYGNDLFIQKRNGLGDVHWTKTIRSKGF